MAKIVTKDAVILYHDVDLSGYSNDCQLPLVIEAQDSTNYASDGWRERLGGLRDTDWQLRGMLDTDPETLLMPLALAPAAKPMSVSSTRPLVADCVVWFADMLQTRVQNGRQLGQMFGFELDAKEASPLIRGVCLETVTRTATGNSAALDLNVAIGATDRFYYAVHVLSVSGTSPTLDLVLESDDDSGFPSATTRATLAQFTDTGSAFGYVAGPITDEYWRVNATVGGSDTPTFNYIVLIGRMPADA